VNQTNRSSTALVLLIVDAICKIKQINFWSWRCKGWLLEPELELILQEETFLAFSKQGYPLTVPNHLIGAVETCPSSKGCSSAHLMFLLVILPPMIELIIITCHLRVNRLNLASNLVYEYFQQSATIIYL